MFFQRIILVIFYGEKIGTYYYEDVMPFFKK